MRVVRRDWCVEREVVVRVREVWCVVRSCFRWEVGGMGEGVGRWG